jgi:ubiquinone/menaquinone biosynthesis C-methylase UbiE
MLDDAKRWDLIHQQSEDNTVHSHYAEEKEKLFPRGSLVVDLGGGGGQDALYFLRNGHSVVVLDVSEHALSQCRELAKANGFDKQLVTQQVDFGLHKLPIKPNSVDAAYSRISLNYFGKNHTTKLFTDIYNMLKPGGKAYLTFKSPADIEEMEYLTKATSVYEPNVFIDNDQLRSRFTAEQLTEMLKKTGIANFQVNPVEEELAARKEGHKSKLFVNEIVITK